MITEEKIESSLKSLFETLEFTKEPAGLYDPLRYMISISGKRLRPRLCLTAYGLFKDEFNEEILQPAAALEVFHNFTLIHDDIMDKSPLRRGVPTVWVKWKEDTAILSGDVMLIDAYQRVAKAPADRLPAVLKLFSDTAAQVCDGQQYDMDFENRPFVGMNEYMEMIGLKTGVLIACAAKMGAVIAGASEEDCRNLYDYAYTLGLAFQIASSKFRHNHVAVIVGITGRIKGGSAPQFTNAPIEIKSTMQQAIKLFKLFAVHTIYMVVIFQATP